MADERDSNDAVEALETLAEETRLDILRALAEQARADPEDPTLSFTELRERAGVRDSGRFNHHLQALCGRFVRERADGYELGYAGRAVVDAGRRALAKVDDGTGDDATDGACPVCGEDDCNRLIHVHLRGPGARRSPSR